MGRLKRRREGSKPARGRPQGRHECVKLFVGMLKEAVEHVKLPGVQQSMVLGVRKAITKRFLLKRRLVCRVMAQEANDFVEHVLWCNLREAFQADIKRLKHSDSPATTFPVNVQGSVALISGRLGAFLHVKTSRISSRVQPLRYIQA
eukprot:351855-Chlamydomonas_euryale.AAC.6